MSTASCAACRIMRAITLGVHHAPAADSLPRDLAKIVSHLIDTLGLDGFVHSTDVGRAGA